MKAKSQIDSLGPMLIAAAALSSIAPLMLATQQVAAQQTANSSADPIARSTFDASLSGPHVDTEHHFRATYSRHIGKHAPSTTVDTLASAMSKTFTRVNSMRAYHMDLHQYRPSARLAGDPEFVDSLNPDHQQRCSRHMEVFEQLLKSFHQSDPIDDKNILNSMRLADAFGRPESGLLAGNQFWLGDYDNCLNFEHALPAHLATGRQLEDSIKGQYCLGVSQFPNWDPHNGKTWIKVGLCLPGTCTTSMINESPRMLSQVESMMKLQFGKSVPFDKITLRDVYCLPHETSPIRQYSTSAKGFMAFVGAFALIGLVVTLWDSHLQKVSKMEAEKVHASETKRDWRTILIESFSITRNLEKFFHVREEQSAEKSRTSATNGALCNSETELQEDDQFNRSIFFNSLTGIKCIGLFWIICAHTLLVAPITTKNLIDVDRLTKTYLANLYITAHLMVDTFFTISGMLASYSIFRNGIQNIKTKHWIILTIHRYWRLTPIYLITYWYTKSVGHLLNTGPMWDYSTAEQSPRYNCERESWLEAFLHLSDFKSPKEHCVPFAWFIANGIKFWIVTPFFLVAIHRSLRRGYQLAGSVLAANILLVIALALNSTIDVKSVIEFRPESAENMLNDMGEVYCRPYSRIGTYIIGLLAGHILYLIETKQIDPKLSKNSKLIGWILFTVVMGLSTFVLKIADSLPIDEAALPWIFGICSGLIRPLWAICTCWLIFAMAHGQVQWLSRFLSANFWKILVKTSFCAYLIQGEVIAQLYLAKKSATSITYDRIITDSITTIVCTLLASLVMVILIEYPLTGIEELILPKRRSKAIDSEATKNDSAVTGTNDMTKNHLRKAKCD